jgi:hypothetical protein
LKKTKVIGWNLFDEEDPVLLDEEDPVLENLWEMKERLSREREARLAQKKKARSKETVKRGKRTTKQNNDAVDTQTDFRLYLILTYHHHLDSLFNLHFVVVLCSR